MSGCWPCEELPTLTAWLRAVIGPCGSRRSLRLRIYGPAHHSDLAHHRSEGSRTMVGVGTQSSAVIGVSLAAGVAGSTICAEALVHQFSSPRG